MVGKNYLVIINNSAYKLPQKFQNNFQLDTLYGMLPNLFQSVYKLTFILPRIFVLVNTQNKILNIQRRGASFQPAPFQSRIEVTNEPTQK